MNEAQKLILRISEEVYGASAIGYHRTDKKGLEAFVKNGAHFIDTKSGTYGSGVYLTYDLGSQFNNYMIEHYGQWIIKCHVNLNRFLIFDHEVAAKVYGHNNDSWQNQLVNIFHTTEEKFLNGESLDPLEEYDDGNFTSDLAKSLVDNLEEQGRLSRLYNTFRGLVFTGRNDGHVIVAFDHKSVTPLQWAYSPGTPLGDLKFKPVDKLNKETLNRMASSGGSAEQVMPRVFKKRIQFFLDELKKKGLVFDTKNGSIDFNDRGRYETKVKEFDTLVGKDAGLQFYIKRDPQHDKEIEQLIIHTFHQMLPSAVVTDYEFIYNNMSKAYKIYLYFHFKQWEPEYGDARNHEFYIKNGKLTTE